MKGLDRYSHWPRALSMHPMHLALIFGTSLWSGTVLSQYGGQPWSPWLEWYNTILMFPPKSSILIYKDGKRVRFATDKIGRLSRNHSIPTVQPFQSRGTLGATDTRTS